MKKVILLTVLALMLFGTSSQAQNIAVNATGAAPNASAMLDITSTTGGLLIPRMTIAQRNAIAAPATGLLIFQTDGTSGFWYYNGVSWQFLFSGGTPWVLNGNAIAAADFFGSTNAQPVRFFSNNIERFRINATDGEFVAGATISPYVGDMLAAVANPALTFAVNGYSVQNGSGIWGEVLTGSTTAWSAVQGVYQGSGTGSGALGNYNGTNTSNTRSGVFGMCSTPAGIAGGAGVYGYNNIASGNQHMGVLGNYNGAAYGIGVYGIGFGGGLIIGNNDIGVVGWRANNGNYSGYFNGNHVIANGTKSASVGTSKGNQLLYVTETPEVWFEDVGRAKLVNGKAEVILDPMFLETVFIDSLHPIHVFVQAEGECNDLYVIPGTNGFTVKEKNGGTSTVNFSYRIMAKRLHFQDHRFGNDAVWGEGDTRKYSGYATPPPVDYKENVKFQEEQKRNYKPTPMPEGFIDYFKLQEEVKQKELIRTNKSGGN